MADISRITSILETVEDLSPSGFAIAFHIRMTASEFQFQTYPKDWMKTYSEKGYVMVDPIVGWGFANTGAIRWSDLSAMDPENVLGQSAAYGARFGTAIAVEDDETRSVAGFARPDRGEISVFAGVLDDPHDLEPTGHAFFEQHMAWLDTTDDAPRWDRHPPGNEDRDV